MEDKLKSIIYLEDRVKKQDNEIISLKQESSNLSIELRSKEEIIKALEHTNERLLKVIEKVSNN